jgi:hypothetical protein
MRAIARRQGGSLVSDEYVDLASALLWRCAKGHEWWTAPQNVKRGSWCPECRGRRSRPNLTLEDMRATAADRGGECLSRQYFDTKTPM